MKVEISPTVLFLCTGNYYRSRFAELYFNELAVQHGSRWRANSRGLQLFHPNEGPISKHTIRWLTQLGVSLPEPHRYPIAITETDLHSAHHVVAVKEAEHRPMLAANFPRWVERVEYWHVHDLDCATPDAAMPHLENELNQLLDRLAA